MICSVLARCLLPIRRSEAIVLIPPEESRMKLARRDLLVTILLCGAFIGPLAAEALAQGTITGTVIAADSRLPVPGARVAVVGTNIATSTREDGTYQLRNVTPGDVEVQVFRIGHVTQKKAASVTRDAPVTVDFTLAPAVAVLSDVITTAVGGQERRIELGNSVAVVNAAKLVEEIRSRPHPTSSWPGTGRDRAAGESDGMAPRSAFADRARSARRTSIGRCGSRRCPHSRGGGGSFGGSSQRAISISSLPARSRIIQVVKGPSAADAVRDRCRQRRHRRHDEARTGRTSAWSWTAEHAIIEDRNDYPDQYRSSGTRRHPDAEQRSVLAPDARGGTCVQDTCPSRTC